MILFPYFRIFFFLSSGGGGAAGCHAFRVTRVWHAHAANSPQEQVRHARPTFQALEVEEEEEREVQADFSRWEVECVLLHSVF